MARASSSPLEVVEARADGMLGDSVAHLPGSLTNLAVQLSSVLQHLQERLDILSHVAHGETTSVEMLADVYGRERLKSGAMSLLGRTMHEDVTARSTARLISAAASERAKAAPRSAAIMARQALQQWQPRTAAAQGSFRSTGAAHGPGQGADVHWSCIRLRHQAGIR